jgi:lipoate-protein ligase A
MEEWRLIELGSAEPLITQTFYEAVHRGESPSTLILVQPAAPYACIGYHQDFENIAMDFYGETGAQSPGVTPRDFAEALMKLRQLL